MREFAGCEGVLAAAALESRFGVQLIEPGGTTFRRLCDRRNVGRFLRWRALMLRGVRSSLQVILFPGVHVVNVLVHG